VTELTGAKKAWATRRRRAKAKKKAASAAAMKGHETRKANAEKKAAEEAAAEAKAKAKRSKAARKGHETRKANAEKKGGTVVVPHFVEAPMRAYKDGSRDVDYDKLLENPPPELLHKGVYLPTVIGGSARDVVWKVGKTEKDRILDRIQKPDNKLIVREIISEKAHMTGRRRRFGWYVLPCPEADDSSIDGLESHLISMVKNVNPEAYNKAKTSKNYRAILDLRVGIAGIEDRYIGAGNGVVKGFNAEARRVAGRLASSLGME